MSRVLPSCIFASILQDAAAVPPVSVGIIVCNANGNVFSCKFACISDNGGAFPPVFRASVSPRRRRLPLVGWSARGAGPLAAAGGPRRSAVQPGTLAAGRLSFPPLSAALFSRSLSPAGGLCPSLVFSCFGCPAGGFDAGFCPAGYGCIRWYILFYSTAPGINARARVRGCRCSLLLLCPLWGC